MMTRFIIIILFLFNGAITNGQIFIKDKLHRQEVNNLLKSLNQKIEDTIRIDILLRLAEYNLEKDDCEKADMDSAGTFIRHAKKINLKQISRKLDGLVLYYESSLAIKSGNITAGRQWLPKAISQLQTSNDEFHLAKAYLELSRCYDPKVPEQAVAIKNVFNTLFQRIPGMIKYEDQERYMFQLLSFYNVKIKNDIPLIKLDFLDHLVRAYRILNSKTDEFWARKEIADIHYQQGKLNEAITELLEIAKEQKAGDYPRICFTYDLLSALYSFSGNYDKALYFSLETIKSVRTELDSNFLSNFYERITSIYILTGSTAEAVDWNLKRLNYLLAIKRTDFIYSVILNITSGLIRLGRSREALDMILDKRKNIVPVTNWDKRSMLLTLTKCYEAVNNKAMAEKYCEELIKFNERRIKRKEITMDAQADQFVASFYLAMGQYNKAEKYFKILMNEWPEDGKGIRFLYKTSFLFKLDSARGNYLSAIKYLQAMKMANDSIFSATKSKQIEELKIAYQTEQKEDSIKLKDADISLLKQQNDLQQVNLQQAAFVKKVTIAGIILAFVIIILLYRQYRLKQRSNNAITHKNELLQHFLTEKEWLLKEIHHRVKNNLQIVMSLLNSQSAYIDNEAALTAIHDSQHRVHAMSLIHQKLYGTDNVSSIDMPSYICEMASYLGDSFDTGQRIRFELAIEPLEMDVSQAVPLGLILNEAITNSIKYAFPNDREGIINITLSNTSGNQYLLEMSDNGVGMPVHSIDKKKGSLGMSLMAGLSEDLDGSFSIENNNGTVIKILFVRDMSAKRPESLIPSFVKPG